MTAPSLSRFFRQRFDFHQDCAALFRNSTAAPCSDSNLTFLPDRAIIVAILEQIGLQMLNGHRVEFAQDDSATLAGRINGKGHLGMAAAGRDSFLFAFAYYYFYFAGGALRVREVG